jgi:hypothetical protein
MYADGVQVDERRDARDHEDHEQRQRVDEDRQRASTPPVTA